MNKTFEEQRGAAEKIVDAVVKERVLRGIELVRREYGDDWVEHIDPATFSIRNIHQCVLGQLESHRSDGEHAYNGALRRIDGEVEDAPYEFGFDADMGQDTEYEELQEAWLAVIGAPDA